MKVAINGFGRIGRSVLRAYLQGDWGFCIDKINDIAEPENLAYLINFDSTHGRLKTPVILRQENDRYFLSTPKGDILLCQHDENWQKHIVLECTGQKRAYADACAHIALGARHVVIGAAPFDHVDACVVVGVNDAILTKKPAIISSVSCTTQALVPLIDVMHRHFGVARAMLSEIHAVTGDQSTIDRAHRDVRRGRTALDNIIPTTSSSIRATELVLPYMTDNLLGHSIRVPTKNIAAIDVNFILKQPTSAKQINALFKDLQNDIIGYNDLPLVSMDFLGDTHSLIVDANQTMAMGDFAKVFAWYDNETGYAHRLLDICAHLVA